MATCRECGKDYELRTGRGRPNRIFCQRSCSVAHSNRRAQRGALIYDLMAIMRYQRADATRLGIWATLCRVMQEFRTEDTDMRDGRQSWDDLADIMDKVTHLRYLAKVHDRTGRRRA